MNEQAFPQNTVYLAANGQSVQQGPQGGMALRDYFAAKAMHAFIVEPQWGDNNSLVYEWGKRLEAAPGTLDRYAQVAYMLADAMLEARKA